MGISFFICSSPAGLERFEVYVPLRSSQSNVPGRSATEFSIIEERLCADVAELAPINGVWLKCLSLGEQIRAYEKMFKNIASLSHTCYNFAIVCVEV